MYVESTGVGIDTPGVQDTSHEDKNNECEDDYTREISYKGILAEDIHHPHITSPIEKQI